MKKTIIIPLVLVLVLLIGILINWYLKGRAIDILKTHKMQSIVGKVEPDGQIKAVSDNEGYLVYGPYMPLKKGDYTVRYMLLLNNLKPAENPSKIAGYCDINIIGHPDKTFRLNLAMSDFQKKNPTEAALRFSVPDGNPQCEFRVYVFGGNKISLLSLKLYPGGN